LKEMSRTFRATTWFIEGDIKGRFDNIDHSFLLSLLSGKIKDSKFINLIGKFLKAGYMEDWNYHKTYSGTPQGGILSPILANIYLHELDKKVEEIKKEFSMPAEHARNPEYARKAGKLWRMKSLYGKCEDEVQKKQILKTIL